MSEERILHPVADDGTIRRSEIVIDHSIRHLGPSHFLMKIQSFTLFSKLLSESGDDHQDSIKFEAGSYNWRLNLFPDGDKRRNAAGYLSLYLEFIPNGRPFSHNVRALVSFFVHDSIRDRYLCVRDGSGKLARFNAMNTKWGIPKLLSHQTFKDPICGYFVDDCFTFGVEVFTVNSTVIGQTISCVKVSSVFPWKINDFSKTAGIVESPEFTAGGLRCKDLIIKFEGAPDFDSGQSFLAKYKLKVFKHVGNFLAKTFVEPFSASKTFGDFVTLLELEELTREGYLVEDCLLVRQEFINLALHDEFS